MQTEFGFVGEVTRAWVRPLVMPFKPFVGSKGWENARGKFTLESWLMWHAPLNGGGR